MRRAPLTDYRFHVWLAEQLFQIVSLALCGFIAGFVGGTTIFVWLVLFK